MTTETLAGGAPGDGASPASFQTSGPGAVGDLSCAGPGAHPDWLTEEMDRQHAAGLPLLDNVSDGSIDYDPDGDDLDGEAHPYVCPTCGGNGCRVCAGSGELVEWTR